MKLQGKILTISNFFSFSRILLLWPVLHFLKKQTVEANWTAFAFMVLAALTDFFDGYLARKLDQRSDLGRIIDPIADKIALAGVGLILVYTHGLPMWFLCLIIGRDLAILSLGLTIVRKEERIPESNWFGKFAVGACAVTVILYAVDIQPYGMIFLYISTALLIISTISYGKRYLDFVRA